jgi:hypothetical protein
MNRISLKSVSLETLRPEQWRTLFGALDDDGGLSVEALYERVAPVYLAVSLRARGLASLPWRLLDRRGAVEAIDVDALADLVYAAEIDYLLHGAAYWLRDPAAPLGLRRMHPATVRPVAHPGRGLTGFERRVGENAINLDVNQVAWLWEPNARSEIGPGPGAAARALADARRAYAESRYLAAYYERGAIRPTVWMFETPPPESELRRFENWLRSLVGGVANAFRNLALSTRVETRVIGDLPKDVIDADASRSVIESILTAFAVPHSLVLSNAANYATADRDWRNFVLLTLLPHARRVASALTRLHFGQTGQRLEVAEANVEAVQAAELEKAQALQSLTGTILTVTEARERLELPPIDDLQTEIARLRLRAQLDVAEVAARAGVAPDAALRLAGLQAPAARVIDDAEAALRVATKQALQDEDAQRDHDRLESDLIDAVARALREVQDAAAQAINRGDSFDLENALRVAFNAAFPPRLANIAANAALAHAQAVGVMPDDAALTARALSWSMERTARLVEEHIAPTTRDVIEQVVAQWRATEDADRAALVRALEPAFGRTRAETIAITAATEAATQGARAYRDYLKQEYDLAYEMVWYTAADERVCPVCGALHGKREGDWNGLPGPPAHPRCRCGVGLRRAARKGIGDADHD